MTAPSRAWTLTGCHAAVGTVLDLQDEVWIRVVGSRIDAMGQGTPPAGGRMVDVSRHLVIPALLNGHTHIDDSFAKELGLGVDGWDVVMPPHGLRHRAMAQASREEVREGMRHTMQFMESAGTAAFADFRSQGIEGCLDLTAAAAGMRVRPLNLGRWTTSAPFDDDDLDANTAGLRPDQRRELLDLLEVADGFTVVTANAVTDRALAEIAEIVHGAGAFLAVHAAENERYREISLARTGRSDLVRVLDHLRPDLLVHLAAATPEELDAVAASGIPIAICHQTHSGLGYRPPDLPAMVARGIPLLLGTDNVLATSPDLLAEASYATRYWKGSRADATAVDERDVLRMLTVDAARALRQDDLGSLSPGKAASMMILDLDSPNLIGTVDPLRAVINRARLTDVRAVLLDGEIRAGALPATSTEGY